ncbi:hypothetical protein ABPG72_002333 [Tetrahymena utriculariae]
MGQIKSRIITNFINKKEYTSLQNFTSSHLIYHEILVLDFNQQLFQEDAILLANTIKKCEKVKNLILNLSKNKLDFQSLQLILEGLHECLNLEFLTLKLRYVSLVNKGEYLGSSIAKNINIKFLNLILNFNCFDNKDAYEIVMAISKCPNLQILGLNLFGNDAITDQGISFIGQGLSQYRNLQNLKLSIELNNSGLACLQELQYGISQCQNLSILYLQIGFKDRQIIQYSINTIASEVKVWKKLTTLIIMIDNINGQINRNIDLQAKKLDRLVNLQMIYL